MDKIKSILASASGRKVGPPVPPRPPKSTVQQALEKLRHRSPILQKSPRIHPPIARGRNVVYSSASSTNNDHQPHNNNVRCETTCFDTVSDDSPTGFTSKASPNGNGAQVNEIVDVGNAKCVNEVVKIDNKPAPVIPHRKSPVPRPRSKTFSDNCEQEPAADKSNRISRTLVNAPLSTESNSYTKLMMRNQNSPSDGVTVGVSGSKKTRDDELKEKLLNEMLDRSNLIEASNKHIKYNGASNLKRASSFDVLNESLGEKSSDKKVIFHEMLISELSEMRRETSPRLSSAKSSPDISPHGNLNIFEIDKKISFNTFVSLEDSGVEDEGKMDDCSSSGVGDSWDSCKEMENR